METPTTKKQHGGRRDPVGGRPRSGRRAITVWIRKDILDALGPEAAPKIREIVEEKFKH